MHTPFLMRLYMVLVTLTLVGGVARAQSAGSCMSVGAATGGTITADVGLAIQDPVKGGDITSVATTSVPYVFGGAECACMSDSVYLQMRVTAAYGANSTGTVEVWVGTGCDNYTTRTTQNQDQCEQVTNLNGVTFQTFTSGANNGSTYINIPIPATALFSPKTDTCPADINSARGIYVILVPSGASAQTDYTVCSLNLTVVNQGPAPAVPTPASGDGAVTLSWPPVAVGSVQPSSFQILCADANGDPIPNLRNGAIPYYSTCIGGVLTRRALPNSGSTAGTDLGVVETPDLASNSVPLTGGLGAEGIGTQATDPQGFSKTFDPNYLCSGNITSGATSYSTRITGLVNNTNYQFAVVSIDRYGNAVSSAIVLGKPQPTEDLYHRYYNAGGRASGFCFVATAAYGSYENRWVHVLRDFRDEWLLPTPEGRTFVDWYYLHSPPAADWIARHGFARRVVQVVLVPVIAVAAFCVYLSAVDKAVVAMLILMWLVWRSRRKTLTGAVS